jgi:hydrogenase maturation protein HypF
MTFEGQAAMKLEFAAEAEITESYSIPRRASENGFISDWEPMIRQILEDRLRGESAGRISARFHNALADLAFDLAQAVGYSNVVLTGGCFQNTLLTCRVRQRLLEGGHRVYMHQRVPPGDGGIALGQIFVAAR